MNKSPKTPFNLDRLQSITELARQTPEPRTYFQGRSPDVPPDLPANILGFARRQASQLGTGATFRSRSQHHRFVLIAAVKGIGHVCIDAKTFLLREGEALLVFPFQFHSFFSVRPAAICWLFFTFETIGSETLESLRSSPPRSLGETEILLLEECLRNWLSDGSPGLLQLQLATLLVRIADSAAPRKRAAFSKSGHADPHLLAQINRLIIPNLHRPLGVKQLAATLGRSESHLRKTFREATGLGLGRHLRDLRIHRACSLLHDSGLPVAAVAERCGFDSIYSFSRAFKNATGVSPRAYRRTLNPFA